MVTGNLKKNQNHTVKMTYLPSELTSGKGTRQEAMIQQMITIKVMTSILESSRRKYFFIIKGFKCLYIIDPNQRNRFKQLGAL